MNYYKHVFHDMKCSSVHDYEGNILCMTIIVCIFFILIVFFFMFIINIISAIINWIQINMDFLLDGMMYDGKMIIQYKNEIDKGKIFI